jgi:heme-degrading monooxygenase HmoA
MPPIPWRSRSDPDPALDYLVMASRLPLDSYRRIPHFLWLTLAVVRRLDRTPGLIGHTLLAQPGRKLFWTLSAWTDRQALGAFATAMPHLSVMKVLRPHMGATRFTTWTVGGWALPISWPEAVGRLAQAPAGGAKP